MISDDLKKRILLLDGATGTMLQRGYDIAQIHRLYIEAGADIIETDSFNLKGYEESFAKASIARSVVDRANASLSEAGIERTVYVAGTLGPYFKMLSRPDSTDEPASRGCTFDNLASIYRENGAALIDAGCDVILLETVFDPLNAKAALYALETLFEERGKRLPIMISATINDASGRLLSGIRMDAFYTEVRHTNPLSFGINCSFGAEEMAPIVREISGYASCAVSMHPNAGLPNVFGEYEHSPEQMAEVIRTLALEGCVNIAGGCCGTTPEHIHTLRCALEGIAPRPLPSDFRPPAANIN